MNKNILVTIGAIIFGMCGTIYAGETEIILKDATENSGFSVKDDSGNTLLRVQGDGSVRMGINSTANGNSSAAMGEITTASGDNSTAMGFQTTASGLVSTAMGDSTTANGNASTAMGERTIAESFAETVIGAFNTDYAPVSTSSFNSADRLFVIGNGSSSNNRSDAMVVLKNGNTGIGTNSPVSNLHVHRSSTFGALLQITNDASGSTESDGLTLAASSTLAFIMNNENSDLLLGTNGVTRIEIDRSGNIGIGRTSPTQPLQMGSSAHVTSGGVWTNASSREYKENIENLSIEKAINTLNKLNPVTFNYKIDRSENYVGFIAEDVPELVSTHDRKGLSPMDITAVLTKVVKEQQNMLKAQQEAISLLLDKVNNIEGRI